MRFVQNFQVHTTPIFYCTQNVMKRRLHVSTQGHQNRLRKRLEIIFTTCTEYLKHCLRPGGYSGSKIIIIAYFQAEIYTVK